MIPDPASRLFARMRRPELRLGLGCGLPAGGPGTAPTASFNFLGGDTLDSRVTFTRSSGATRTNSAGLIESVGTDVPRFDYDPVTLAAKGLLFEEQRTNLVLNSAINGANLSTQGVTVTAQSYTLSFYGSGSVTLSGAYSGTLNGTGAYPSRASVTFTPTAGTLTVTVAGTVQFAQLEAGAFQTSFIPTVGSQVTRAVDMAAVNSLGGWYNQVQGTFVAEFSLLALTGSSKAAFSARNVGVTSFIAQFVVAGSGAVFNQVRDTGVDQAQFNLGTISAGTPAKSSLAYALNNIAGNRNGAAVVTDTSATIPTDISVLDIGSSQGAVFFNGHIRRLDYYNRRLPDADLQRLTT